jgi:hypothetical protein
MRRFGSRRTAGYVTLLLVLVIGAIVAVATAQAAPSKKNYKVVVAVTKPAAGDPVDPQNFTVTITNDASSNTTLGSANVTLPTGFTADTASTAQTGWTANVTDSAGTSTVELRSDAASNALGIGQSMTVSVHVSSPSTLPTTGCNAAWSSTAKQSNNYLGTNNWFTLLGPPASDLAPLGSFVFAPVQSLVGPNNAQVAVPQILTVPPGSATPVSVKALDTCGNPDTNYAGATFNKESGFGLVNATFLNPSWSTKPDGSRVGLGSVTPKDVEVGDQFTVDDPTTGISATSVSTGNRSTFDVVETICTAGQTCIWTDKNNPIKATSTVPTDNSGQALGLGYQPFSTTSVQCGTKTFTPVGDIVRIDPYNYDPSSTLIVVITYDKSLVGSGPASTLNVCKTTDNGATVLTLDACSNTPVAPCVDVTKVNGGNFQATLYLKPADPGAVGLK